MQISFDRGRWAPATRRSYEISWRDFERWCEEHEAVDFEFPVRPEVIADFLIARSETHSTSTLSGRLAAIVAVHQLYGHEVRIKGSVIKDAWSEIRRQKGTARKPKAALVVDDIKKIVKGIPADQLQDRAVMLIGFASALRRSEIVALNAEDLVFSDTALTINVRRSKTDKAGKGEPVAILRGSTEFCAVAALEAWLAHAEITSGPIFRCRGERMHPRTVANIAKRWAKRAGFDDASIGAHSLRRGCITSMFRAGADIKNIMEHSRHRTVNIAMGYVQAETATKNPALKALRL